MLVYNGTVARASIWQAPSPPLCLSSYTRPINPFFINIHLPPPFATWYSLNLGAWWARHPSRRLHVQHESGLRDIKNITTRVPLLPSSGAVKKFTCVCATSRSARGIAHPFRSFSNPGMTAPKTPLTSSLLFGRQKKCKHSKEPTTTTHWLPKPRGRLS